MACDNSVSCRGLLALRFGFPSVVPDTPLAGFADQPVSGLFRVAVNFRKALGLKPDREWSARGFRPVDDTNEAYKLGVNYLMYGMTH